MAEVIIVQFVLVTYVTYRYIWSTSQHSQASMLTHTGSCCNGMRPDACASVTMGAFAAGLRPADFAAVAYAVAAAVAAVIAVS